MDRFDVFQDIAQRTGGDIYLGVVGPVRTGKSTFIKKFMELIVLPGIHDEADRARTIDELPQSAAGRTIMTTEPKFVPNQAARITVKEGLTVDCRLVDCVGYTVHGARGYEDENGPRMVSTPWYDDPIAFQEAAEIGTRKVIAEHSTIGLVVTTDGSFGEISREQFVAAEERVVAELKELGKPFCVVLNSQVPTDEVTLELAEALAVDYDVPVVPLNCQELRQGDLVHLLEQVLYEFPVSDLSVVLTGWPASLPDSHWLAEQFSRVMEEARVAVSRVRDIEGAVADLRAQDSVGAVRLDALELGTGRAVIQVAAEDDLFYRVLGDMADRHVADRADVMKLWGQFVAAKAEWDKVEDAVREVRSGGYGMVAPRIEELDLAEPELIRRGNQFGVRLKATAPSIHMIRADIETEITPIIGTERQADELVRYLMEQFEDDPGRLWDTNLFGKPLHDLVREGIQAKLFRMPENAQDKLQETLQRIINEGSGGLICIII